MIDINSALDLNDGENVQKESSPNRPGLNNIKLAPSSTVQLQEDGSPISKKNLNIQDQS